MGPLVAKLPRKRAEGAPVPKRAIVLLLVTGPALRLDGKTPMA